MTRHVICAFIRTADMIDRNWISMSLLNKFVVGFLIAMLFSIVPSSRVGATREANVKSGIIAVLTMQSNAWNRGALDAFLTGYLDSEDISFVSAGTEVRGLKALRERYEKKYGKSRETMGSLKFSDLEVQQLGGKHALCIGHWHVERKDQPALNGMFTLVLIRTSAGWRIIHDHTSLAETTRTTEKSQ
jgi:ketosteroid isomerase-like protein